MNRSGRAAPPSRPASGCAASPCSTSPSPAPATGSCAPTTPRRSPSPSCAAPLVRTPELTHELYAGDYADAAAFSAECDEHGPAPLPATAHGIRFTRGGSAAVRRALAARARRLGLPEQRTYDLVAAVHETVVNTVRHGGGHGVVRLHSDPDHVICEIADGGTHTAAARPPFPGHLPPKPRALSGHGMWLVRQLSDLVADDLAPSGPVLRLYFRRGPAVGQPAAGTVNS
ncbi:ATP-binding protein [Streptomyces sp. NPDC047043]|uniref:ATP-binding protein n=1 Tax=Streptomyces sp. NPDC047043 TaxID=3154497 RepID=UPI0033C1B98F